jgi:prepilin-type N-terminal cleavage/methylation domain-containing protein
MRRAPPARGFTLIEIVVVLVILGVVAAVSVPAFRDTTPPNALRDGTAAVIHVLERARLTAVMAGHRVGVTIDPVAARYWIDSPELSGTFELPRDAVLWSDRARAHVTFDASGTAGADPLAVQANGQTVPILVDRFTGEITTNATNAR